MQPERGDRDTRIEGVRALPDPDDAREQVASVYRAVGDRLIQLAACDALVAGLATGAALAFPSLAALSLGVALQRGYTAGRVALAGTLALHGARTQEAAMDTPRNYTATAELTETEGPGGDARRQAIAQRARDGGTLLVAVGAGMGLAAMADPIAVHMLIGWGTARYFTAGETARRGASVHAQVQLLQATKAELAKALGSAPKRQPRTQT